MYNDFPEYVFKYMIHAKKKMIFKLFNQLSLKIMVEIALKSPPHPFPRH